MLTNNIIDGYGRESFTGWLENGEVYRLNDLSENEVQERMTLSRELNDKITEICFILDGKNE